MTTLRRSERINFQRPVTLVYHNEAGRAIHVPASTYELNCHGAGVQARLPCPVGTRVYLMDRTAGIGLWTRIVWQGKRDGDGFLATGLEFVTPGNHWNRRLVPTNWLPHTPARASLPPRRGVRGVRVRIRVRGIARLALRLVSRMARRSRRCQCCGHDAQLVYLPAQRDVVCRPCYQWAG